MRSGIDPQANIDQATRLIKEAVSAGAEYVQTPEMSNMVNGHRSSMMAALRDEASDPMLAQFRDLARAHKIFLHAGSLAIKNGDKVANRAFVIGPDGANQTPIAAGRRQSPSICHGPDLA